MEIHVIILFRHLSVFCFLAILLSSQLSAKIYPIEEWAKRADVSNVSLSPDGRKLALLRIPTREGNPVLEIYDASNLSQRPLRMDADPMEITSFYWVTDEKIIFSARQKVRDKIEGWNQGVYENSGGILTIEDLKRRKGSWKKITAIDNLGIINVLPKYPDIVLVAGYPSKKKGGDRVLSRSRLYYKYNIKTGRKQLVTRDSENRYLVRFDEDGEPRFAFGYDGAINSRLYYYRAKGSTEWKVIYKQNRSDFSSWRFVGFDPENETNLLVIAHNGNDKTGLWSFNPDTLEYEELIYRRTDISLNGTKLHSNRYLNPSSVTAVSYYDGRDEKYEWFDGEEAAIHEQLKAIIPYADRFAITSRSKDGNSMVIGNVGPRDPGTYYMLKNGNLQVIGSRKPGLSGAELADVEFITYKSRDGKNINGFVTIPNSKPPYPLIVMPHGGPFSPENPSFDEWAQLFANRGFMVLQPQFRGTTNLGLEFYKSAFINGGKGGYEMQDDKDDGALYLVEQGLVDPDRMMMFGWSYGGYAALIAASRTPQIYQCVIAAATVPDPVEQVNYYRSRLNSEKDSVGSVEQLSMWLDSISPIKEIEKVNIPMLIIHGDVDQRTPPRAARTYMKALKKYNKDHKVLWLEGADHFYDTLFYHHKSALYNTMTDYLANDCFKNSNKVAQR